jgi:hypothetical protein
MVRLLRAVRLGLLIDGAAVQPGFIDRGDEAVCVGDGGAECLEHLSIVE